jgi:hypothetical protein
VEELRGPSRRYYLSCHVQGRAATTRTGGGDPLADLSSEKPLYRAKIFLQFFLLAHMHFHEKIFDEENSAI